MLSIILLFALLSVSDSAKENSTSWYDVTATDYPIDMMSFGNELESQGGWNVTGHIANRHEKEKCPLWMYFDRDCKCMDIPYRAVQCDDTIPRTTILDCFCMTYNYHRNQTELGRCIYGCARKKEDTLYNCLPNNTADLNEFMCGYSNRNSTLCGKCQDGYSPLVYSYEISCKNCTGMKYNWLKYIAVAYVPSTAFFLFVVISKFSGTSPLMRAYITTAQGITSPVSVRTALFASSGHATYIDTSIRLLATVYGVWNLDFFRTIIPPICIDISPLQALLLDYAQAVYPMVLVVITYLLIHLHSRDVHIVVWLWKPFKKICDIVCKDWQMQGSVINAFATFLLLSFLRVVSVSFDLLVYTEVYISNGSGYSVEHTLYYDASVEYFGKEHLPFAITAICVSAIFSLVPMLFLILYPMRCFQRCLNALHVRRESIDMFVNCFQGYYKDGTEGTRDYRYFSVVFFLAQMTIFFFFSLSRSAYCYSISALILIVVSIVILFCQPYKEQFKVYTLVDVSLLLIIASLFLMINGADTADMKAAYFVKFSYCLVGVIAFVPFVYFVIISVWWIFMKKRIGRKVVTKMRACARRKCIDELSEAESVPDRLKNPMDYQALVASQREGILCAQVPNSTHSGTMN